MPLFAWFKQDPPKSIAAANAALTCKDYLRLRLTGRRFAEITDQSTSAILDGLTRTLDPNLFALGEVADLLRLVPAAVEPMAIAGTITAEAASATGCAPAPRFRPAPPTISR